MLTNNRFALTTVFLIIILCISLANANSALADEGAPTEPPPATGAATEPPMDATEPPLVATEMPVESTPAPAEATPTPEPSLATATQAETAEDTPVTELLSQIPEETNLVVLDENGQALSVASQNAAEIIEVADPIWCPEGQTPTIGLNGCTNSFASIFDLLNDMNANPGNYAGNGIIYLENTKPLVPATTITSAVVIDNSTYSNLFTNLSV
jgi:cytoskeletal protein RodZ